MDKNEPSRKQVQLLIRVLPTVFEENCFALKGGTAINLFIRDMPRLSVDIDLVYLPDDERTVALENIRNALARIADKLEKIILGLSIHRAFNDNPDALRLFIEQNDTRIKVETSPVLRGTVNTPEIRKVRDSVEDEFGYVKGPVVSLADLYGGKICAALDRQHPRDLFDIKLLLEKEGITDDIRKAFLVYLISHARPMAELLNPNRKDISSLYENEFSGIVTQEVSLKELETTRESLIEQLNKYITNDERNFLLSFKRGEPDWDLLGLVEIDKLPAVMWKQQNLDRMIQGKREVAIENLRETIYGGDWEEK